MNKIFGKSRSASQVSRYYPYYYNNLDSKYDTPGFYNNLYYSDKYDALVTPVEIYMRYKLPFGCSSNNVSKALGKPNHVFNHTMNHKIQIHLYRLKLGGHKTKCELHFYNDQLFFFTYIFSYLNKDQQQQMIEMVQSKYQGEKQIDIESQKLTDENKNSIIIQIASDFSLMYLWGNKEIYAQLHTDQKFAFKNTHKRLQKNNAMLYRFL